MDIGGIRRPVNVNSKLRRKQVVSARVISVRELISVMSKIRGVKSQASHYKPRKI